ncbi:hydrogenase expression/formation protein HypE, partial [Candidatus Omnitrophota bacterium]
GGRLMHELIGTLRRQFSNKALDELADAAELTIGKARLSFSTDSYVVKPLFFPGGDIGKLAVCGTVNDIAMKGAKPLFLSLSFIIEEGLDVEVFEKVCASIRREARQAGVTVVTGDTKVVERGAADKLFINTSGIGLIYKQARITSRAKPGDVIVINGPIAEHGIAVFNARNNMGFSSRIKSDCRSLAADVARCCAASDRIRVMRDPTRGGLATTLNEIALSSNAGIEIDEKSIPIAVSVKRLSDVLGLDPLYMANEGKFVCFVDSAHAQRLVKAMGRQARIIGRVVSAGRKQVRLNTAIGSSRILPMLEGEQLPRIC